MIEALLWFILGTQIAILVTLLSGFSIKVERRWRRRMGNKMAATEIIRILEILIGPTTAVGETNADEQIYKNLQTLVDVVNWGLESIHTSSFTCGRPEYSMHKVGYDAKCALDEWRMWLDDMCGEVQE